MLKTILQKDNDYSLALRVAEKPGLLRNISMFLAHSGDSWFWALGMLILWLAGDAFWKLWAVYQFFWISLLAILVIILKFVIRRRRPEGEWGAIYRNTDPHSFPSGHAARSFLIALIAWQLGPTWLGLILWVWAPLVALARVAMGVHYLSDIIAGMLVGLLVAGFSLGVSPSLLDALNTLTLSWFSLSLW